MHFLFLIFILFVQIVRAETLAPKTNVSVDTSTPYEEVNAAALEIADPTYLQPTVWFPRLTYGFHFAPANSKSTFLLSFDI